MLRKMIYINMHIDVFQFNCALCETKNHHLKNRLGFQTDRNGPLKRKGTSCFHLQYLSATILQLPYSFSMYSCIGDIYTTGMEHAIAA